MGAIRAVTGLRGFPISKAEPRTELPSDWGKVVPTFHPAYVLRRGLNGPEMRRLVADLEHARSLAGLLGTVATARFSDPNSV
jgi:hypothetical protein